MKFYIEKVEGAYVLSLDYIETLGTSTPGVNMAHFKMIQIPYILKYIRLNSNSFKGRNFKKFFELKKLLNFKTQYLIN